MYWKTVDAGDYKTYAKKFLEYYIQNKQKFFSPNTFWNALKQEHLEEVLELIPELKEGTASFGKIKEVAILFIWHGEFGSLHTDHTSGLNAGVQARLQIPVANTEKTRTAWIKLTERELKLYSESSGGTKMWPHHFRQREPITWVEILQPTIIRTDKPHTVYLDGENYPRITITISFKEDVVKYLDEV